MPIATYQKKVFQVSTKSKYILSGLAWSSAISSESQDKLNSKASTYIKGQGLTQMGFTIPLFSSLGHDVRKEIDAWEAILLKQTPDYFILGTKPVGKNKWLLKSVGVSETEIDGKGTIRKAILKIDLEEYVRAGKAEVKKSEAKTALSTGSNIPPSSYITKPLNKVEEKRVNPSVSESYNRYILNR